MSSACSYVYADKFTARVQNVRLPNARMLWGRHATGQWMRRWRLVQCCSKRSADTINVMSQFVNISNICLVDALLHCSPDFVVHRGLRSRLFGGHCSGEIKSGASLDVRAQCVMSTVCWSTVLLKHELIPWYLPMTCYFQSLGRHQGMRTRPTFRETVVVSVAVSKLGCA